MIGGVIISNDFSKNKKEFDSIYRNAKTIVSIIPFHLTPDKEVGLLKNDDSHNEEYYRQQLIYSLVYSEMYSKDYMGCEIEFPKGNKNSANVKIDMCPVAIKIQ